MAASTIGLHDLAMASTFPPDLESSDSDLITDQQYHYVLMFFMLLWLLFSLGGIFTNIINILTFLRMRLEDSVTISFFLLSMSDCGASLVGFFHATTAVLRVIQRELNMLFKMDPFAFAVFCAHYRRMLYDISVLTTTFLALQRCCCVAFPLQFKGVFTRRRTVAVLMGICGFAIICYLPMFITHGLVLGFDPATNMTRYLLWMSDQRSDFVPVTEVITAIIMPTTTQIIVIACLLIIAICLKRSSKFRQISSSATSALTKPFSPIASSYTTNQQPTYQTGSNISFKMSPPGDKKFDECDGKYSSDSPYNQQKKANVTEHGGTPLERQDTSVRQPIRQTSKEMQVIKAVALVSIVFVVCNTPKIITANLRQFIPGFDVQGRLFNVYLVGNCIRLSFELFNSAVNLIIYYKFNTKFKRLCVLRKSSNGETK